MMHGQTKIKLTIVVCSLPRLRS